MNVNGLLDQLRHTFHNERDKSTTSKKLIVIVLNTLLFIHLKFQMFGCGKIFLDYEAV